MAKINREIILTAIDSKYINDAQEILLQLEEVIAKISEAEKDNKDLETYKSAVNKAYDLSNSFYEILSPTGFAYSKIPPIIDQNELEQSRKILQDLIDLEVAFKIILGAKLRSKQISPYDYCINSLNIDLSPVKEGFETEIISRILYAQSAIEECGSLRKDKCIKEVLKITSKVN